MRTLPLITIATLLTLLTGCEAIGNIFEAGIWVGVIGVVVVVAVIGLIVSALKR